MVREPIEITKKKSAARARAVKTVLDRHRPELNDEIKREMAADGFDWTPTLTPEERAEKEAAEKRAKALSKAQTILEDAGIPMVVSLDPTTGQTGDTYAVLAQAPSAHGTKPSPIDTTALRQFIADQHAKWSDAMKIATSKVEPFDSIGAHRAAGLGQALVAAHDEEEALAELVAYGVPLDDAPRVLAGLRAAQDGTFQGVKFDWDRPADEEREAVDTLVAAGVPPEQAPHVSEAIRKTLDGTAEAVQVDWRRPADPVRDHDHATARAAGVTDPAEIEEYHQNMERLRRGNQDVHIEDLHKQPAITGYVPEENDHRGHDAGTVAGIYDERGDLIESVEVAETLPPTEEPGDVDNDEDLATEVAMTDANEAVIEDALAKKRARRAPRPRPIKDSPQA